MTNETGNDEVGMPEFPLTRSYYFLVPYYFIVCTSGGNDAVGVWYVLCDTFLRRRHTGSLESLHTHTRMTMRTPQNRVQYG